MSSSPWKWLSLCGLLGLGVLLTWHVATLDPKKEGNKLPGPAPTFRDAWELLKDPFYDKGSNDKGVGVYAIYSVGRVLAGFLAGSAAAVVLGTVLGLNRVIFQACSPYMQILKAVSPIAWMPLFMYTVKDAGWVAFLVVFMASLWPTVANTAFGVSNIRKDLMNVALILQLSWSERLFRVVLPAAGPTILQGLRISYGAAWVAVVPAEALLGTLGLGYFIWNEWNGLNLTSLIVAVLLIGVIGVFLEFLFNRFAKRVAYAEA
jgi:nitrate/nitrite transport system permease protein